MENIIIRNAYENNLKHIDVEIPLNSFTCVTGCSGCGKSSLVFDTIYAESQRGFLEGMSGNLYGQKLMDKPKVDAIQNLRPALNISQNYYNVNPRSTVGTVTEISYYIRALFSLENGNVSENYFSANNPSSFCSHCNGLGIETVISENKMIPDRNKKLKDGAILYFKGGEYSKEFNCLKALCEYYNIDIEKKVSELTEEELNILLYSTEKIKYKVTYRDGKRRKQHFVYLQGAISSIQDKLNSIKTSTSNVMYINYMEQVPCKVCKGLKLKKDILDFTVNDKNISEVENLEFNKLLEWLLVLEKNERNSQKKELVKQLVESIEKRITALIDLNVGYLNLSRSIPSLSGGEKQRIRIATQLNCSLKDLIYILDEPCKGLHYHDIKNIINATKKLVESGNTVISIEHNKQYISSSEKIIELGPKGGPEGGYLLKSNSKKEYNCSVEYKEKKYFFNNIILKNINYRNILNQNVKIPIGSITCITGVSGSGKSTLVSVIQKCYDFNRNIECDLFEGGDIKRVYFVNQNPIGKTPRSTIASYLEIYDAIRTIFAKTKDARNGGMGKSNFSINVKSGRCECCQGTGMQKIELNYLPDSFILCPNCKGKRFEDRILQIKYKGKNISEILDSPIEEIIELFEEEASIYDKLKCMIDIGLEYLSLGRMSMKLSGGEAQRIKLAKALGVKSSGKNLYILDEPTSGLNETDIKKFINIIMDLQKNNNTLIIIEHNLEFIAKVSDYIIDFGLAGGKLGGKIVAAGTPKEVFNNKKSSWYALIQK